MPSPINNNSGPPEAPSPPAQITSTVTARVNTAALPALPTLKEQLQKRLLGMKLNAWVQKGPELQRENYNIARRHILAFVRCPTSTLKLTKLNLSTLPDIFDHPVFSQLQELDLRAHRLQALPASIGNLSQLRQLDLCFNQFQVLPDFIGTLSQLQELGLSYNQLRELSDSIGTLSQLRELYLSNNQFQELPDSISDLSELQWLWLRDNTSLSSLPDAILLLPQRCKVDLENVGLSMEILARLLEAIDHEDDYQGPRFSFSISDSRGGEIQPLETLLDHLFLIAGQEKREFSDSLKTETLHSWLSRVFEIGKFENSGERKKVLANKILGYLKLAEENEEFRDVFLKVLDEAATTCGDRVWLSILHFSAQYRLAKVKPDVAEVSKLLKGIWALSLLEDCARNKVPTLRFVDEIEVYLAFPVRLKERLNLPIDVEDMLYFSLSGVTEEDLQGAEEYVSKMWKNREAYVDFLIQQPKWLETLKASYPEKYGEIERQKERATEEDNPDYDAANKNYKRALKELSETAL